MFYLGYFKEIIDHMEKKDFEFLDLIHGSYYQKIKQKNTLHLMICSDGIAIRNSTQYTQFWPVLVGLVELPRSLRDSLKNKMICGNNIIIP